MQGNSVHYIEMDFLQSLFPLESDCGIMEPLTSRNGGKRHGIEESISDM